MAEYKTDAQVNYGWGLSLNMTGKAPAIAKRIFSTLADAQAYVDDAADSAIAGLHLSVIKDEEQKNGIYFVKSIGDGESPGVLVKVGADSDAELAELSAKILELETNKQDKIIAGNGIDLNADGKTVSIKLDSNSGLSVSAAGLKAANYEIVKLGSAESGASASYQLQRDGEVAGVTINIPKDMVVSSGSVKVVESVNTPYEGAQVGDVYIDLVIANSSSDHLYIPANKFVDNYTGSTYITVSEGRVINLNYSAIKTQLDSDLGISTLKATVGNSSSGLVKDVANLKTTVESDNVREIDTTSSHGVALATGTNVKSVKVVVTPATLATDISPNLSSTSIKVGKTISSGASIGESDSVATALEKLGSAIQTATSGGITSIESSDNTITVSGEENARDLKVNIAQLIAADSAIQIDESGKLDIFWTELV